MIDEAIDEKLETVKSGDVEVQNPSNFISSSATHKKEYSKTSLIKWRLISFVLLSK